MADDTLEVYETIVDIESDVNWMLCTYTPHLLQLSAYGTGGLSELKAHLHDCDGIGIAFYREEKVKPGFAVINYISPDIEDWRREKALTDSNRVAEEFTKTGHGTLTIDHLANLTPTSIHQAIVTPDSPHTIQTEFDIPPSLLEPMRRSFTESYAPHAAVPVQKTASMFSGLSLLKRKGRKGSHSIDEDLPPPPTPPKDKPAPPNYRFHPPPMNSYSLGVASRSRMDMPERRRSVSEFAIISHHDHSFSESDESSVLVERPPSPIVQVPLAGKWNPAETTVIADPAERARRRQVARRQRELEEAEVARQEEERQAEIQRMKEEQRRVEEQEERERRERIERDMRMSTLARRRKKEAEERAEEEKKRELAEKRIREREKRFEEHRRLEQWRTEQARIKEEELRREEAERNMERAERNKRIEQMAARVKRDKSETMLAGWATVQINDSLVWRRRYYKFIGDTMFFYRSPKDMNLVVDQIQLRGKLNGLKEWSDGYEELKAIPNSFAIEFKDDRGPCAMFCDTEEEKDKLLGVLHYTAGL
ncbi:hypothetical protein ARMGADRAFT_1056186 [Armillaria gallica]|uniref:ADF-H domain-containing protein n=1 Tax=Armillaria gallica TaxID=47427 RepID=A0A2H3CBI7_ARMGA|nr:hypothetical protein ARMGADRAFT_1056186 [Armillaria gallica]